MNLVEMLQKVAEDKGSDLHLVTNVLPCYRVNGTMGPIRDTPFTQEEADVIVKEILPDSKVAELNLEGDTDLSYKFPYHDMVMNTRVNVFRDARGVSFAFRLIHSKIPNLDSLMLPRSLKELTQKKHGLVIVTGPTGSGKTTTLAALIDYINATQKAHIITIEDPIEYIFHDCLSVISQREVGRDCSSFARGLKSALRQDPDVILVGELRDAETIMTALSAAETGHLVFATLHTANVIEAMDRLVQYFPVSAAPQIRSELANSFEGIVAQHLFKRTAGGRVAAFEVLLRTNATVNLIRKGEGFRLNDYLHNNGMQSMEDSVQGLKNMNLIDKDVAW